MQDMIARLANRMQLTTAGFNAYRDTVEDIFGVNINHEVLDKNYSIIFSALFNVIFNISGV